MKAQRGSRDIVLLFFLNLVTRLGWVDSAMPGPIYRWESDPVPVVQVAGWAPGLVWTCATVSSPPGFDPWTIQPIASCCIKYAGSVLDRTVETHDTLTVAVRLNVFDMCCSMHFCDTSKFCSQQMRTLYLFLYVTLQVCRHTSTRVDHHRGISYIEHFHVIIIL
jgi:hypothetical protein